MQTLHTVYFPCRPQFSIQAANSSLGGVTAVSFYDGKGGVFADMPIISGYYPLTVGKTGSDTNGVQTIDKDISSSEAEGSRGFGFQLYPSKHG